MKRLNFDILDENHDVTAYERHYTSSLLSTRQRRNSSPAISTLILASAVITWSGIGQASAYDWRNTPSELCDFHSQSQGRCWHVRTALETLSTQIGGEWSASRAKENYWTLLESEFDSGFTSHLFDTPGFDIMIAKISWRQMHKTIIFCLNFARQLQTNHEQTCTQNRPKHPRQTPLLSPQGACTHVLTASWQDSACGVGSQCCWTLSWRCEFCSPFIHTHSPVLELLLFYFSKKKQSQWSPCWHILAIETVSKIGGLR